MTGAQPVVRDSMLVDSRMIRVVRKVVGIVEVCSMIDFSPFIPRQLLADMVVWRLAFASYRHLGSGGASIRLCLLWWSGWVADGTSQYTFKKLTTARRTPSTSRQDPGPGRSGS